MKKTAILFSVAALLLTACNSSEVTIDPVNPTTPEVVAPTIEAGVNTIVQPNVGGPNEPNQVYVDLRTNTTKVVKRDSWDLGFYAGEDDFRVVLNGAVAMTAKELSSTNIDEVQTEDPNIIVSNPGQFNSTGMGIQDGIVDNPAGWLKPIKAYEGVKGAGTAIAQISATDAENKVYLLNLGFHISTITPAVGSVNTIGDHRGWLKIRVLRKGSDYVIQYAGLKDTSHKEITVQKNADYNFMFVNLTNGKLVDVQPKKTEWDLCFTTHMIYGGGYSNYSASNYLYFTNDIITTNIHAGTRATFVQRASEEERDQAYNELTKASGEKIDFTLDRYFNQMAIGRNWRAVFNSDVRNNLFFLVKDVEGNYYKMKFLSLTNTAGERGYPTFQYELMK